MTKAAIYCRVDHGSSEYGQVAVSCQRKRLEHYAKRSGLTVTKWYADCGFAGNDLDRPALKKLLRDHAKGKFSTVLVVSPDRLYRGSIPNSPNWSFKIKVINRQTMKQEQLQAGGNPCRNMQKRSI